MRRLIASLALLFGLLSLDQARATYLPEVLSQSVSGTPQTLQGHLTLGGQGAISVSISSSQAVRLDAIAKNFRKALYEADDIPKAWVKGNKPNTFVMIGNTPVFSVLEADIRLWKTQGLAWPEMVMGRLNKALQSLPSLGTLPSKLYLPIGELKNFQLMPANDIEKYSLSFRVDNPAEAFDISVSEAGVMSIKGSKAGEGWLYLNKGHLQREIWIKNRYTAGVVVDPMVLVLSYPLPDRNDIETFARAAVATHVFEREGSKTSLAFTLPPTFRKGIQKVPVKVRTTGPDYFDFYHETNLEVRVQGFTQMSPKTLFMSNSPERVKAPQKLFEGAMESDSPVRLMLHHLNDTQNKLLYTLKVRNVTQNPAAVYIQGAYGGPSPHETALGYMIGKKFYNTLLSSKGMGLTIPAQSTAVLWRMRANPKDVVSLLWNMESLGAKVVVTVEARYADIPTPNESVIQNSHPELVFSYTNTKQDVTHRTSESWKYITLGHLPPESGANQKHIRGNFGGMESVSIKLENDEEIERKVWIKFDPAAGYAGALFLMGSQIMEIRPTNSREELIIFRDVLPPGGSKTFAFKSLTLPGSNYPVKLIVAAEPRIGGPKRRYE